MTDRVDIERLRARLRGNYGDKMFILTRDELSAILAELERGRRIEAAAHNAALRAYAAGPEQRAEAAHAQSESAATSTGASLCAKAALQSSAHQSAETVDSRHSTVKDAGQFARRCKPAEPCLMDETLSADQSTAARAVDPYDNRVIKAREESAAGQSMAYDHKLSSDETGESVRVPVPAAPLPEDWKLTDAEIAAALENSVLDDDRAIADAAGRKALEWAARQCEAIGAQYVLGSDIRDTGEDCAAAIRAGAKP